MYIYMYVAVLFTCQIKSRSSTEKKKVYAAEFLPLHCHVFSAAFADERGSLSLSQWAPVSLTRFCRFSDCTSCGRKMKGTCCLLECLSNETDNIKYRVMHLSREFNLAPWDFLNFQMCKNSNFYVYNNFSY